MKRFSFYNSFENQLANASVKANTVNKHMSVTVRDEEIPLVPIPPTFPLFKIVESAVLAIDTQRVILNDRFGFIDTARKEVSIPEIDRIGSLFIDEKLPYTFTSYSIDYENERSGMLSSRSNTDSGTFGWSFDIVKLYKRSSVGEINIEYQKQLSASSQYWLGKQENKAKISSLETYINRKYQQQISTLTYENPFNRKTITVGLKNAEWFITKFNEFIYIRIDAFFAGDRRMNNGR